MNLRNVLIHAIASATLLTLVSCGGDSVPVSPSNIGGTLAGSVGPVVLRLNGGNDLTLAAPGAFTFSATVPFASSYAVTTSGAEPQNCNVTNGAGTVAGNISNVTVTCTTVVRSTTLSGATENPVNASTATGRGAVIVNPTTREITGGISFSGLTPNAGGHHIHQAPAGNPNGNGPVIIGLTLTEAGSVVVPAGTTLTAAQYTALLAGELYMNVHTAAFPGGEIRGQLTVRGGVTAGLGTLTGAQEVPPNATVATGRGTIVFDTATRALITSYTTHNVAGANNAHIHTGATGVAGPVTVPLNASGTGIYFAPFATSSPLSAQFATDLNAGNTYFNVHSPAFPAGEIRGQIAVQ